MGLPAWTRMIVHRYTGGFIGLEELAARINPVNTFDRRGNVLLWDDFEHGLVQWGTTAYGDGTTVASDTTWVRSGGKCVKCQMGTTTGSYVKFYRSIWPLTRGKWGLEISFTGDHRCGRIALELTIFDGTFEWYFEARVKPVDRVLQVFTPTGYVDLSATLPPQFPVYTMHTLKVVVDVTTHKYVRVIYDETEYDASAYGPDVNDAGLATHSEISMRIFKEGGHADFDAYLDDFILTKGEP